MGLSIEVEEPFNSLLEPGIGALFHVVNLFEKKKIGYKELKQIGKLADAITQYQEFTIENVIKTVLVEDKLQLYLFDNEIGWFYNCTLTKTK